MGIIRGTLLGREVCMSMPEPVTATGVVAEKASTGKRMEDLKAVVANAEAVKAASLII